MKRWVSGAATPRRRQITGPFAQRRVADGDDLADAHGAPGHRDAHTALARDVSGAGVAGVRRGGSRPSRGRWSAPVRASRAASAVPSATQDHSGVDRTPDPDSSAMVDRDPRGPRGRVHERVEQRQVGNHIRPVGHPLGLAISGEATEPESRWSRPITIGAESSPLRTISLKRDSEAHPFAVAEPADSRRQPLEGNPLGRGANPAREVLIVRKLYGGHPGQVALRLPPVLQPMARRGPARHAPARPQPSLRRPLQHR